MEDKKFCYKCGKEIFKEAEICPECGCRQHDIDCLANVNARGIITLLLCIFLGTLGIHRFYVGKTGSAIAMLLITVLLGWILIGVAITGIWSFIDLITIICGNFEDGNGNKIRL